MSKSLPTSSYEAFSRSSRDARTRRVRSQAAHGIALQRLRNFSHLSQRVTYTHNDVDVCRRTKVDHARTLLLSVAVAFCLVLTNATRCMGMLAKINATHSFTRLSYLAHATAQIHVNFQSRGAHHAIVRLLSVLMSAAGLFKIELIAFRKRRISEVNNQTHCVRQLHTDTAFALSPPTPAIRVLSCDSFKILLSNDFIVSIATTHVVLSELCSLYQVVQCCAWTFSVTFTHTLTINHITTSHAGEQKHANQLLRGDRSPRICSPQFAIRLWFINLALTAGDCNSRYNC